MRYFVLCSLAAGLMAAFCSCKPKTDSAPEPSAPAPAAAPVVPVEPAAPQQTKPASQAFFDAALAGNIPAVEAALEEGVNPDSVNPDRQTAIMLAAFNGHTGVVELLAAYGADVNHTDVRGRTALMFAASGPAEAAVKLLLEKGAKVDLAENTEQFTALMFAAAEGQAANVKLLLEHSADRTIKDVDGDTAADFAARNGHTQVVGLLRDAAQQPSAP